MMDYVIAFFSGITVHHWIYGALLLIWLKLDSILYELKRQKK